MNYSKRVMDILTKIIPLWLLFGWVVSCFLITVFCIFADISETFQKKFGNQALIFSMCVGGIFTWIFLPAALKTR
jgi:ABC-type multidrug transport system permease subunit